MNCKWKMVTVQDLIDAQMIEEPKDGNHGNIHPKSTDYVTQGIPFIMANDLVNGRVDYQHCAYISEKQAKTLKKGFSRPGDVLLTHKATIGRTAIVTDDYETIILTPQVTYYRTKKGILNRYLKYYFDCAYFQSILANWAGAGSTRAYLGISAQKKLPILLPPLEIQKKIAKVLSALDDKIELNNQINKNLEEQAQALYNSWFVDFEPFGGVMPADWAQADIYSLAEVIYGAPFASKYFNNTGDGIPIIRIRDLKEQKFITYTTEKHSKGYLLQKGDIVVGMDGEFRPYIWGNSQAWLNQRVCVFKNKRPNGKAFLYYTIKPLLLAIEQTQVATTVIHIGKKDFDLFKVALPANEILDKFDNITTPIIDQIVQNTFENKILCDIRETLLPKLMSGEIDVDNVEI